MKEFRITIQEIIRKVPEGEIVERGFCGKSKSFSFKSDLILEEIINKIKCLLF